MEYKKIIENIGDKYPYFTFFIICIVCVIISLIVIGDFFNLENLIRDFKLLPVPEINTAVFILFFPVDRTI